MSDGKVRIDVDLDTSTAEQKLNSFGSNAANELNQVGKNGAFKSLSDEAVAFAGKASLAITAASVAFGGFAIKSAGDMAALEAQFEQVFDGVGDSAQASLNKIAEETHMLPNRLKGSFTQMAAFAKTTGMNTADALSLTERATLAAADSAAFYDRSIEDVTESLQSFLKGNYENDAALGISATETTRNAAANDLYGKSFKDLDEAQKQLTLLKMVEDGNKLSGALGQASREANGMENVLGNLKQAGTDLGAAFGAPLLDPFLGMVNKVSSALSSFANVLKGNPALVYAISGAVTTLAAALGAVWLVANKAMIIGKLTTAMSVLSSPVFLVVAAIGALITALVYAYNKSETFRNAIDKLIQPIKNVLSGLKLLASGFKEMLTNGPGEKVAQLREQFIKLFPESLWQGMINFAAKINDLKTGILAIGKVVSGSITDMSGLGDFLEGSFSEEGERRIFAIGNALRSLFDAIKSSASTVISNLIKFGTALATVFKSGDTKPLIESFKNLIPTIATLLLGGLPKLLLLGSKLLSNIADGMGLTIPELITKVTEVITNIIEQFALLLPQIIQTGADILTNLINGIAQMIPEILPVVLQIITTFVQTITEILPTLIEVGIQILTTLISGIIQVLPTLIETGIQLLTTLIDGIIQVLPTLIEAALQIIIALVTALIENLPKIIDAGIQLIIALIDGIIQVLPQLVEAALRLLITLVTTLISYVPQLLSAGVKLIGALISGVLQLLGALLSAAGQLMLGLLSKIGSFLGQMLSKGAELVKKLVSGIINSISSVFNAGKNIGNSFVDAIRNSITSVFNAGKDLVQGFINGIGSMIGGVVNKAKEMAKGAVDTVKGLLNIHSPSRVFLEIGKFTGEGFVNGLEKMISPVSDMSEKLAEAALIDERKLGYENILDKYASSISKLNANSDLTSTSISPQSIKQIIETRSANTENREPKVTVFESTIEMDSKQVGKATAKYVEKEINKNTKRGERLGGNRI